MLKDKINMDTEGDKNKRPPECKTEIDLFKCPHLIERNLTDMHGERYRCDVCGKSFYLDYDEMR